MQEYQETMKSCAEAIKAKETTEVFEMARDIGKAESSAKTRPADNTTIIVGLLLGQVVMDFGSPIRVVMLTPKMARMLADQLRHEANTADPLRKKHKAKK